MRLWSDFRFVLGLMLVPALHAASAEQPAPALDVKRIVNESYNFKKNNEPEMTEEEYALYEKIVSMVQVQPELALKLVEGLIAGKQQSPAFEFVLGNIFYTSNRAELAEQHYRKALALHPEFTRAWSNLGAMFYAQGRYADAAECLVKTIEGGERDAHTLGLLAFCLKKTDRKTAAKMDYIQALGLDPTNTDYLEGLVEIYYEDHDYAQAESLLAQLIKLKPESRHNWLLYASVLRSRDRPLEAIAVLEAARSLNLLQTDGLLLLGDLYERGKFYPEAIEVFRQLRGDSVKLSAVRLIALAESLIASGQLKAAEEALTGADANLAPEENVLLHLARANYFAARADSAREKEQLEGALAIDPLNGRGLLALGRYYKAHDDMARADIALESATRQPEYTYRACVELADVALKTRRYQRGLEYLERAYAIEKDLQLQPYIARIKRVIAENENAPNSQ